MSGLSERGPIPNIVDCAETDVPDCWQQLLERARVPDPELSDLLSHLTSDVWCFKQGNRKAETVEVRASSFNTIDEACAATGTTHGTWQVLEHQTNSPAPLDENLRTSFDHLRLRSFPAPDAQEVGIRCSIRTLILDRLYKSHRRRTTDTPIFREKTQCTFYSDAQNINGRADLLLMHQNTQPWQDPDSTDYIENALLVIETERPRHHEDALPRLIIYLAAVQQARLICGMQADVFGLSSDGTYYQFLMLNSEKRVLCSETFDWGSREVDILKCLDFVLAAAIRSSPVAY